MEAAQHQSAPDGRQVRGRLWFGLLGGAGAWLAHLLLSYAVAEFGCVSGLHQYQWLGISLVAWILLAISLLTASVAAAATRSIPAPAEESSPEGHLGRMGCLSSGSFFAVIVVESIPILYYLSRCW